jgi:branched-chain amino acid transport system ATP-binding protein
VVLYNGAFIADGEPRTVIRSPQVAEIYMGIEADGIEADGIKADA